MTMRTLRAAGTVLALATGSAVVASGHAAAGDLTGQLGLPAACEPGRTCWISVYMDDDPGSGVRDYNCTAMTSDGHDGIDFAITDTAAMAKGVAVLAAAPGKIVAARDGMPDVNVETTGHQAVAGRECGNGVAIDHGDGWQTQYCHMRALSITAKPGQTVAAGTTLGMVGMSGLAEYPHLHFIARKDGKAIDPFRGLAGTPACGPTAAPLWRADVMAALPSGRGALYNGGLAGVVPTQEGAQTGAYRADTIARGAPALTVWGNVFNVAPGDVMEMRLVGPSGQTIAQDRYTVERKQVRLFRFAGKRTPPEGWPAGTYRAEIAFDPAGPDAPVRRAWSATLR